MKNALEHQVSKQLGKVDTYGKTSADYVVGSVPGVTVKSVGHTDLVEVLTLENLLSTSFNLSIIKRLVQRRLL